MGNVEGETKGGVHTYGLAHSLHIVLGMHMLHYGVYMALSFSCVYVAQGMLTILCADNESSVDNSLETNKLTLTLQWRVTNLHSRSTREFAHGLSFTVIRLV